jgi:hypothetical protein
MPYSCAVENGRIKVKASAPAKYDIVGKHEQQPLTVCRASTGGDCRTFMVHQFSISCGGARVPWVEVAAAARGGDAPRSWIDDENHLNMLVATRSPEKKCAAHAFSFLRNVGFDVPSCMPWQRPFKTDRVIMPEGFAPIGLYGGRLVAPARPKLVRKPVLVRASAPGVPAEPVTATAPQAVPQVAAVPPEAEAVSPVEDETREVAAWSAAARAPVATSAIETGSITPAAVAYVPRENGDGDAVEETGGEVFVAHTSPTHAEAAPFEVFDTAAWHTVMNIVQRADISGLTAGPLSTPFIWISVVLLLSTLTWFAWRHDHSAAEATASRETIRNRGYGTHRLSYGPASSGPPPLRVDLANAGETCAALLAQTQIVVDNLSSAGPLREVLHVELNQVRQRLASACVLAASGGEAARRAASQFRALVHEIERTRRIAEGAAASITDGTAAAASIPRTRSEAYVVLGINPDVSDGVAKKIVDGLRASWHPDHAKDDNDLRLREARIKQINVAWELINDKRQAA